MSVSSLIWSAARNKGGLAGVRGGGLVPRSHWLGLVAVWMAAGDSFLGPSGGSPTTQARPTQMYVVTTTTRIRAAPAVLRAGLAHKELFKGLTKAQREVALGMAGLRGWAGVRVCVYGGVLGSGRIDKRPRDLCPQQSYLTWY